MTRAFTDPSNPGGSGPPKLELVGQDRVGLLKLPLPDGRLVKVLLDQRLVRVLLALNDALRMDRDRDEQVRGWMTDEEIAEAVTDVNPEGFWAQYEAPKLGRIKPFAGAGYFILRESSSGFDTTMYGGQAGLTLDLARDVKYTVAGYWQDYDHYDTSGASPCGNDSPLSRVPAFGVIGLNNAARFKAFGQPVSLFFDWAHNCAGRDRSPDYGNANNAYYAGLQVGKSKKKGDWSVKYCYAVVQANALPGFFVDSDFGHGNRRGHVLRGQYKLLDNLTAGVNLLLTEPVFSPTTNSGSSAFEDRTVTIQADLVWKF